MSKTWPLVKLGEILTPTNRQITVDPSQEYRLLGIRLDGGGPFLREQKLGSQLAANTLYQVKDEDFIYSRLFAWRGAFGVICNELDGCFVSNEFPAFIADKAKFNVNFLKYWFHLPHILKQVEADCTGSTPLTRNRYKENFFLNLQIPLPPLTEQQAIVAKIERLAGKIEEAKRIKEITSKQIIKLFESSRSKFIKKAFKSGKIDITSVANLERGKFSYRPRNEPRFFGGDHPWIQIGEIESSKKYIQNWTKTLNDDGLAISRKFKKGTLLISIAATIGAVGILDFDCCVPDSIVAMIPKPSVDIEFLYHYLGFLRTHLEEIAPQSAQKNINLNILSQLPFPNIPIHKQRHIGTHLDSLQTRLDKIETAQAQATAELNAMLPSILDKAFKGKL